MRSGTFYLNNDGSRWVVYDCDGQKQVRTFTTKSGKKVVRTVIYNYIFGNFAGMCISYGGKRMRVLADEILDDLPPAGPHISDVYAKKIASSYYAGQWSGFYSLCSTGIYNDAYYEMYLEEIDDCEKHCTNKKSKQDLSAMRRWIELNHYHATNNS